MLLLKFVENVFLIILKYVLVIMFFNLFLIKTQMMKLLNHISSSVTARKILLSMMH